MKASRAIDSDRDAGWYSVKLIIEAVGRLKVVSEMPQFHRSLSKNSHFFGL